ncbi:hypothetical protein [Pontiella sulfatireligans]|uniref:Uncharacterized protein n=1 Tax=Pontiella sulfatireligans TaxID=2750658 RepID=A0A6C2UR61_9BACT|nr:hypothetical protein [Pontiella sulfatireligans]VGO22802.1 hypothetical protein SCARR_04899 [Pontiella sulfatireligans]
MIKQVACLAVLALVGCSTTRNGAYRPKSGNEKEAYARAWLDVSPDDVRKDFQSLYQTEVAWAGIIKEIEFRESEREVSVAFLVEHRNFDWKDHGGGRSYQLEAEGEGVFAVGWKVEKPTSISYLKSLADAGDMLVAYGRPVRIRKGTIQLSATAVRPISADDYSIAGAEPMAELPEEPVAEPQEKSEADAPSE